MTASTRYAQQWGETMEYVMLAYALIALVLIGYTVHLHWRMNQLARERALLETKNE